MHRQTLATSPLRYNGPMLTTATVAEKQYAFPVHWVLLASVGIAVLVSVYVYFIQKNYDFFVEAPCNAATNECYVRDCSEGDCPPNGLATYRVFNVPATLFSSCEDNSCMNVCAKNNSPCTELLCSDQSDVECAGPKQ